MEHLKIAWEDCVHRFFQHVLGDLIYRQQPSWAACNTENDYLPANRPEIQLRLLLAQHQGLLKKNYVFVNLQIKIGIKISLKSAKINSNQ